MRALGRRNDINADEQGIDDDVLAMIERVPDGWSSRPQTPPTIRKEAQPPIPRAERPRPVPINPDVLRISRKVIDTYRTRTRGKVGDDVKAFIRKYFGGEINRDYTNSRADVVKYLQDKIGETP
jgi:hypothetical protein